MSLVSCKPHALHFHKQAMQKNTDVSETCCSMRYPARGLYATSISPLDTMASSMATASVANTSTDQVRFGASTVASALPCIAGACTITAASPRSSMNLCSYHSTDLVSALVACWSIQPGTNQFVNSSNGMRS